MATVSVRKIILRGEVRWCVDRREGGKRKRTFFPSKAAADALAAQLREQIRSAGEAWLSIPARERDALILTWQEAQEAGYDLAELLRQAKANELPAHVAGSGSVTIAKAIAALMESREEADRSERYRLECRQALERFARGREELPIAKVTVEDVRAFLRSDESWSAWTRATYRRRLATLFRFARRRGWMTTVPTDEIPEPSTRREGPPPILTPEQHAACLAWLQEHPRCLGWYVLSTMCGLRPEEAQQTPWSMILLAEGAIRVEAQTSKVRQRRVVYPRAEALAWLRRAKELNAELPIGHQARRRALRRLREVLAIPAWPQDLTRHSAATYWLAVETDLPKLAHLLGTSVDELQTKYLAQVTRTDATRFWAVAPGTPT